MRTLLACLTVLSICIASHANEVGSESLDTAITQEEAVDWVSNNLLDGIPKLAGSTARIVRNRNDGQVSQLSTSPASRCLYSSDHCQCSKIATGPKENGCLRKVGVDEETGSSICEEDECPENVSYACACDGDTICRIKEGTVSTFALDQPPGGEGLGEQQFIHDTYFCHARKIIVVEPVDKEEMIDGSVLSAEPPAQRTIAWNSTHCTCTQKVQLVKHSTCYERRRRASSHQDPDLCIARRCNIDPGEFVCDLMMGKSLCERSLVSTQRYAAYHGSRADINPEVRSMGRQSILERMENQPSDSPVVPERLIPCVKESYGVERLKCISSCLL